MGVYFTDRTTGAFHGVSSRLFVLLGEALAALGAQHVDVAWSWDGYVPSWLARSWGTRVFEHLEDLVVVTRPMPGKGGALYPVAVYRRGDAAGERWRLQGEQLSVYDTPAAMPVLAFAQYCSTSTGFMTTTLRPPAPGCARSEVAARWWLARSGLFHPMPDDGRRRVTRPAVPRSGRGHA